MTTYSVESLLKGAAPADTTVTCQGWIRTRRDSKAGFSFLQVYDGSGFHPIQVVAEKALPNYESDILKLTAGCSVKITGTLVASPGKGQQFEIQAASVEVVGLVDQPDTYPISPKHHSLEYLREVAHLRPRTNVIGAMTRVRHTLAQAIHQFFSHQGFNWIHTPIITGSDCEGAGEMFRVSTLDLENLPRGENGQIDFSEDFFGKETFLTVSGQLNLEAYCLALSKVYTFGPTFRAENSNTTRHLAEFWMVEPEVAFADINDNADLAEAMLKSIFTKVLEKHPDEIDFFTQRIDKTCRARLESVVNTPFARITYTEAVEILEKSGKKFEHPVQWGLSLQSEHERYLTENHYKGPVIVTHYPKECTAFYMRLNDDQKTVANMDVLVPGMGEIIGGSQREERLDVFDARLKEAELETEHYSWYRDLRKYGTVPHAGFGLGFERAVAYVTGLHNVRDVIPFPRTPGHADF